MAFSGTWLGEGAGTFVGQDSDTIEILSIVTSVASVCGNIFSGIRNLQQFLDSWQQSDQAWHTTVESRFQELSSAISSLRDRMDSKFQDLSNQVTAHESASAQRKAALSAELLADYNALTRQIGEFQALEESYWSGMQASINTVINSVQDAYSSLHSDNLAMKTNLENHDRNIGGRCQMIYDRCGDIKQIVDRCVTMIEYLEDNHLEECRVKLRGLPLVMARLLQVYAYPLDELCTPGEEYTRVRINGAPRSGEGGSNFEYDIVGPSPYTSDVTTITSDGADYVEYKRFELDDYGKFRGVTDGSRFYFSKELPAVLTWPFRVYGDGGNNIF